MTFDGPVKSHNVIGEFNLERFHVAKVEQLWREAL